MIIYQASKTEFLHHALRDDIEDIMLRHVRHAGVTGGGESEVRSWRSSLFEMAKVLQDEEIPDDASVNSTSFNAMLKQCLALPPGARSCQTQIQKSPQLRGLSGFSFHQVPGRARRGITPTLL